MTLTVMKIKDAGLADILQLGTRLAYLSLLESRLSPRLPSIRGEWTFAHLALSSTSVLLLKLTNSHDQYSLIQAFIQPNSPFEQRGLVLDTSHIGWGSPEIQRRKSLMVKTREENRQ